MKYINVKTQSVFDVIRKLKANNGSVLGYTVLVSIAYHSKRYNKTILVEKGDVSDGATGVPDIDSFGWIFHDELCNTGLFEDGTKCTNLQASTVLSDIMASEGRWFRRITWFAGTWAFGGGKARKNGMI